MNTGAHLVRYLGVTVVDVKTDQASLFPALDMGYPEVEVEEVLSLYDVNKLTEDDARRNTRMEPCGWV